MSNEQAKQALRNKVASQSTDKLVEMALILNLRFDQEAQIVSVYVESELEKRMGEDEMAALYERMEADLDEAA